MNFILTYCSRLETDRRWRMIAIWLIIGAALLLRIMYSFCHPAIDRDEFFYLQKAMDFAQNGNWELLKFQPFLPVFLAAMLTKVGHLADVGAALPVMRSFSAVLGSAGIIFVYPIGKMLFSSRRYALFLLAVAAVHPTLVMYGGVFLRESLALPLAPLTIYGMLQLLHRPNFIWALLLGAVIAIGGSCRTEYPEFLFYALLGAAMAPKCREQWPRRLLIGIVLLTSFAAIYLLLPLICGGPFDLTVGRFMSSLRYYCQ